jgi:hypothetical protein
MGLSFSIVLPWGGFELFQQQNKAIGRDFVVDFSTDAHIGSELAQVLTQEAAETNSCPNAVLFKIGLDCIEMIAISACET